MFPSLQVLALWITTAGIMTPGQVAQAAGQRSLVPSHELIVGFKLPTRSQSVLGDDLLLLQQRVHATARFGSPLLFQAVLPDPVTDFRLLVRGSVIPRFLLHALALPREFDLAPVLRQEPAASLPDRPQIGADFSRLPMMGGGMAAIGPFANLSEEHVGAFGITLTSSGDPRFVVRLAPGSAGEVARALWELGPHPAGLLLGGRIYPLPSAFMTASTWELYFPIGADLDEAAAILGLIHPGRRDLSTRMDIQDCEIRAITDRTPFPSLSQQVAALPIRLTGNWYAGVRGSPPFVRIVALGRALEDGYQPTPEELDAILGDPEPGIAAAILRVAKVRIPSVKILSLLRDPRPLVRDSALTRALDSRDLRLIDRSLKELAGRDELAWAAPLLAGRAVRDSITLLEDYVKDGRRPYPLRRTALESLVVLAPRSPVVSRLVEDPEQSLHEAAVLGLAGSREDAGDRLAEMARSEGARPEDRLTAVRLIWGKSAPRGLALLKQLARAPDPDTKALARRAMDRLTR